MITKRRVGGNRAMRRVIGKKVTNNKKAELLSMMDEKLDNIGLEYGPIVYDELQSRLEKTVDIFNKDLKELFDKNFSTYKSKSDKKSSSKSGKKPKYISDYEKSKKG